uniref:Protein kinase domain-containing protein n=1 Tax=viral metagenome TaxID=1070528 RepID=A0A6C0KGH1_9ZZZZ
MKIQKGGVRLSDTYLKDKPDGTLGTATDFFILNSTFKILTNNSISCITLIATLNNGVMSPFQSMRSYNINNYVNQLLLKIFITNENKGWYVIPGRPNYGGIEITSFSNFHSEIERNIDIYKMSISSDDSLLDGICPAIINSTTITHLGSIQEIVNFSEEIGNSGLKEILGAFNKINREYNPTSPNSISIIVMEFMNGFDTAFNVLNNMVSVSNDKITIDKDRFNFLMTIVQYEFRRLNKFGYSHGDAHLHNIMLDPNYQYFTRSGKKHALGRAIIIDFGRSRKLTDQEMASVKSDENFCKKEIEKTILGNSLSKYEKSRFPSDINIQFIPTSDLQWIINQRSLYVNDITIPNLRKMLRLTADDDIKRYIIDRIIPSQHLYKLKLGGTINSDIMGAINNENEKNRKGNKSRYSKSKKTKKNKISSTKQVE